MDGENKQFIEIVIAIVGFGGLLFGILTSSASEALKYFAITIVLLAVIVAYILFVVMKRIKSLEEKK